MRRIWIWLPTLLALLSGCSDGNEAMPDDGNVSVRLVLNMPVAGASFGNYQDKPEGNDYYLHPLDVQMLVYDTEGTFKDRAVMSRVTQVGSSYYQYTLTGQLTRLKKKDVEEGTDFRIVVLCNLSGHSKVYFPIGTLESLTESGLYRQMSFICKNNDELAKKIMTPEESGRIPMWGKVTTEIVDNGVINVNMLRAMAKVRVQLSGELQDAGFNLSKVVVDKGCAKGLMTPFGADGMDATPDYLSKDNNGNIAKNDDASFTITDMPFYTFPEEDGIYYTYLPEQEKGKSSMAVTINDSEYSLEFGDYEKKERFPVVRNYYYDFTITKIFASGELAYKVCQWEEMQAPEISFD